jgi:hypothetical protein
MKKPQTSGKRLRLNLTPYRGERMQCVRSFCAFLSFPVNPAMALIRRKCNEVYHRMR